MEQSIYFKYIQKYFPKLVLGIVEKLNGKNQTALSYMFKQLLTPTYSVDGRWDILTGTYTRVAADVVAMDSPLPLKKRDSLSRAGGDLPKLGIEMYLNEKQMSDIDALIAQGMDINTIVQKIFEDTPRVIQGIWERLELMFLEGLSTGIALADTDNVGTGIRVDYGYLTENQFKVDIVWQGNTSTSKPLDDIKKVMDKAEEDGNTIIGAYADQDWFDNFNASDQVRQQFAFLQGFAGDKGIIPLLDNTQSNRVLSSRYGFTVTKIDRTVITEKNGVRTAQKPWKKGTIVFVCDASVGSLVWTRLAEMNHPVSNVAYQTADNYILVSKYRVNRPSLKEFTTSQARVVPIISNPDRIYTLDTKEAETASSVEAETASSVKARSKVSQ